VHCERVCCYWAAAVPGKMYAEYPLDVTALQGTVKAGLIVKKKKCNNNVINVIIIVISSYV
jgi:hypothetical protein